MSNAKELIKLIQQVVKIELKKAVKPLIREMVQSEVNAVLAERFVSTLANKSLISETQNTPSYIEPASDRPKLTAPTPTNNGSRKKELLKKMGVDSDPMMQMLFEDVSETETPVAMINPDGTYVDADDEGIDISDLFGR